MKVIVSHDVDHLQWKEHLLKDVFVYKFLAKTALYGLTRDITFSQVKKRIVSVLDARLHRIPELIQFDKSYGITPTFFVAVNNALGLSYSQNSAKQIIDYIKNENCHVGIHGIAYDSLEDMRKEYNLFKNISGLSHFGIRNHYLRQSENTLNYMSEIGYTFDSTLYAIQSPYSINNMIEFPLTMMDAYMVTEKEKNIKAAIARTKELVNKAAEKNLDLITLNFHDISFGDIYPTDKEWYMWTIDWLSSQKVTFTTFDAEVNTVIKN
jgi:hypothetical protein